jgi:hypothetical protein
VGRDGDHLRFERLETPTPRPAVPELAGA